jgi:hypothetical protein
MTTGNLTHEVRRCLFELANTEVVRDAVRTSPRFSRLLVILAWLCLWSAGGFTSPAHAQQPGPSLSTAMALCNSWVAINASHGQTMTCVDLGFKGSPPTRTCTVGEWFGANNSYVGYADYPCSTGPLFAKNLGSGTGHDGGEGTPCGCSSGTPMVGDPVNVSIGNKYLQEDDYVAGRWLTFRPFYNSLFSSSVPGGVSNEMGLYWRHSFDRSLAISGIYAPRAPINAYRRHPIVSVGRSQARSPIMSGSLISPSYPRARAGSIWLPFWTFVAAALWAGP